MSKGKMWAATFGGLATFLAVVGGLLSDGKLDGGEAATGLAALVTLVSTVYAVWRTRNTPVRPVADGSVRRTYTE
jgi:hypothetical protein